jgi:hypothetical protein
VSRCHYVIVLGADKHSKSYKASPDGVLKDEHNVPLAPFALPSRTTSTRLNPILVNFAAVKRFRHLKRTDAALLDKFSPDTRAVIDASLRLFDAVMWTPVLRTSKEGSAIPVEGANTGDVETEAPSETLDGIQESKSRIPLLSERVEALDVLLGGDGISRSIRYLFERDS